MMNIFKNRKNRKNNTTTTYTIFEVYETHLSYGDVGREIFTTTNKEEAEAKMKEFNANNIHKDFIYYHLAKKLKNN